MSINHRKVSKIYDTISPGSSAYSHTPFNRYRAEFLEIRSLELDGRITGVIFVLVNYTEMHKIYVKKALPDDLTRRIKRAFGTCEPNRCDGPGTEEADTRNSALGASGNRPPTRSYRVDAVGRTDHVGDLTNIQISEPAIRPAA